MRDEAEIETGAETIEGRFGDLARHMLNESALNHAWRINFLANFFTGPAYRELERRLDLSRPEFVILYCLSERPGLAARDVCLVTGLPKNSISRAVARLLDRGFVARTTSDEDRRRKTLALTGAGTKALDFAIPFFAARQAAMREALEEDEAEEFDRLLMKIVSAMPRWVGGDE